MAENARILDDDWAPEGEFAEANGLSRRTVARMRSAPDGLPCRVFNKRIMIHLPTAQEWLINGMVYPNPSRRVRK